MDIKLSEIDKDRFGITVAKVFMEAGDSVEDIVKWCKSKHVDMLIARCPSSEIMLVQQMESAGFFLTDTLVYFQNKKISADLIELPCGYSWRLANENDALALEHLAGKIFTGYAGHYHADPRINRSDADLVYSSWAANSCKGSYFSDAVFLIFKQDEIAAFLTVKKNDENICEIILNVVAPLYQGQSLYSALVSLAKNWALENKIDRMIVSTQLTNTAPQKVWCRQGFEPLKSFYTFHNWFK